jgi:hypothetical protein
MNVRRKSSRLSTGSSSGLWNTISHCLGSLSSMANSRLVILRSLGLLFFSGEMRTQLRSVSRSIHRSPHASPGRHAVSLTNCRNAARLASTAEMSWLISISVGMKGETSMCFLLGALHLHLLTEFRVPEPSSLFLSTLAKVIARIRRSHQRIKIQRCNSWHHPAPVGTQIFD